MKRFVGGLVVVLVVLPACRTASGSSPTSLTVLAAASLTEAFTTIGKDFEAVHPEVTVRFSFGPSDGLATQIIEGAPADVFASASPTWMDAVASKGPGVDARTDFARNRLVLVVPAGNPAGIRDLSSLARPGVRLVLAAPGVPAGDYARQLLSRAGIAQAAEANVISDEQDVKGVLQKVLLGEADAGIVYVTDVTPAVRAQVEQIRIPDAENVLATNPIAVVASTEHPGAARAFVRYVTGPGQTVLERSGFLPPP